MNKADRKCLVEAFANFEQAKAWIAEAHAVCESLASAEREKFDNMSEGLQQGERGQGIEAAADTLDEMTNNLQQAIDALDSVDDPSTVGT